MKFAFLSDIHAAVMLAPFQQRVLGWCRDQLLAAKVDRVVLGGDLTHHPEPSEAMMVIEALDLDLPIDYLPGNNEGRGFVVNAPNVRVIDQPELGLGWPPGTFLLPTTTVVDARESLTWLTTHAGTGSPLLVLAHFPPECIADGTPEVLRNRPGAWVAGHRHQHEEQVDGEFTTWLCAGLDAAKVRRQRPELLLGEWNGEHLSIERRVMPLEVLCPNGWHNPIGLACKIPASEFLDRAVEAGVEALQFHNSCCRDLPTPEMLAARDRFREHFATGCLSIHLPNFPVAQRPSLEDEAPWLAFAEGLALDDLTLHLPALSVGETFEPDGTLRQSWAVAQMIRALADVGAWAVDRGMSLSLENMHNTRGKHEPGETELLSTHPCHLTTVIERVRAELLSRGYAPDDAARVGAIFDVGHAFGDFIAAKQHGVVDWLHRLGPYVNTAHLHQVSPSPERKGNHHPITDRCGPMINYEGVLTAFCDLVPRRVPLFLEIRDFDEALASRNVLLQTTTGAG